MLLCGRMWFGTQPFVRLALGGRVLLSRTPAEHPRALAELLTLRGRGEATRRAAECSSRGCFEESLEEKTFPRTFPSQEE